MIVEVYRGDGLRGGAPIVEPLLADDALIERGRAEMDAHAHAFDQVEMEVVFRPGLRLGQIVEAADPSASAPRRARITGIQIDLDGSIIGTRLTLEQPR